MFHQVVWCRKHRAGNKVGLDVAKGESPAKPFQAAASSSVGTALAKGCSAQLPKGLWSFIFFVCFCLFFGFFLFVFAFCFKYQN